MKNQKIWIIACVCVLLAATVGVGLYVRSSQAEKELENAIERERLQKEEERLLGEIRRSDGMLNNERFISRAPAAKVEEEKAKREKYARMLAEVREHLSRLQP